MQRACLADKRWASSAASVFHIRRVLISGIVYLCCRVVTRAKVM